MAAGVKNGSGLFTTKAGLKKHLLDSHGISAEVKDLRTDTGAEFSPMAAISVDEFTDGAAAGAADLKVATATVAAPVTVLGSTLLAAGLAKLTAFPRNITFTTGGGTAADAPATATITGTYRGKAQTETVTLAQTATIATGVKPFSTITSISYPAADGVGATISIGVGAAFGTSQLPKSFVGGVVLILKEAIDGSGVITTGTLTVDGLYTPATSPNGAHDWALVYLFDPTA